ncbi:putative PB1 domain-containing protein [Lupinus albus]|uniref:Putative PB1 domain-containing protein n=1 Tax=Lupinus albus TaxID=3870 RepID=A0A6A4P7X9_LUPAL|nr:putative PB1 domain-containing protein [Lupinus albus]
MEAQPPPQPTPPLLSQQPHYSDSIDSSPRSRNTDSWDEPYPPPTATKLRLMVSYGGHITPRPHDKTLCYIGGDTRIVVVDRHTSLSELSTRFSKTFLNGLSFVLKYQLPDEDLDSLISVTTDEDFDNMIEEFDHRSCNSSPSKPSRIRLFLFPAKPASSGPVSVFDGPGSGLGSAKSEDWLTGSGFLDGGLSDSASVNCLLRLDDEVGAPGSTNFVLGVEEAVVQVGSVKNLKPGHDVQSVPDSPIRETNSSFGSTSSSVANLPSIKVRVEDGGNTGGVVRGQDQKVEGVEEGFAKLGVGQKQDEEIVVLASPVNVSPMPVSSAAVAAGEYQNRVLSDDERSDHGVPVGCRKLPNSEQSQSQVQALTPQFQQKSTVIVDLPSPDSVSSDSISNAMSRPKSVNATDEDLDQVQIQSGASRVAITSGDPNHSVSDPHSLVQIQQHVLDPGYVLQPPFGQQQQALQHQFDQQQQQRQKQQALPHQLDQQQQQRQQQQALPHQLDQQQQQRQQQQALPHQFDQQQQQALQHQFDQQQQQTLQHQVDQQKQQQQALQHQFDQQQQALQQQFDQQQQQAFQQQFDQQQRQQKLVLQHQFDQQQQQQALQHQFDQQQQQQALQHQFDQQQQQTIEQQFDQQQQHHQQQTLQRQFDKQQQQEAPQPQQIIHGTHFIHQTPAGPVSIPAYYPVYPSQQQLHPQHHYQLDQQYPVYYLPARQAQAYNLSMQQQANLGESATTIASSQPQIPSNLASVVPPSAAYIPTRNAPLPNSEMATASAYRTAAAGTPQLVQVPSNQHQQQYVAYSQIHHLSQSTVPNSAAPPNYAYNYADPANAQIFYAQNLAPTKPSQSRP